MKSRRRLILAGILLLTAWGLTGGCVSVESTYRYVDDYDRDKRPWLLVHIDAPYRVHGIPFVFERHGYDTPFDAQFTYYTQDVVEGAELVVERLAVSYPDGTKSDWTHQLPGPLPAEPTEMMYVEDHQQVRKPGLRATWSVPGCVTQQGAFTILIAGRLRQGGQTREQFDVSLSCRPFSENRLFTKWCWWFTLWVGASC